MSTRVLPADVETEIDKVVEGLSEEKQAEVTRLVQRIIRFHSGPLPDPESLECYARTIPNGGDRVMALVEREMDHRHAQQTAHTRATFRGQWIGFGLTIVLTVAALVLGLADKTILAGTVFTTTIVGVVAIFVWRRRDIDMVATQYERQIAALRE